MTGTDPTPEPQSPEESPEEPQAAPEPAEVPGGPQESPPTPQDVSTAAGLDDNVPVVTHTAAGSLTLRPNQKALDPEQHAALKAVGIDTKADPGVIPHLRAFVHMCQVRGLDFWAREAYLIGRGRDDKRTYTMQTGIDGYRKMAKMTGRFIRVKSTLWTGSDDDDRSYVRVEEDGDFVMRRIWFDQWPASRGNPGAAKVVIEHYDEQGLVTTTSAVADWDMYAATKDVWEGPRGSRHVKRDADGKVVTELNEMWAKGGPHMLAKCAEALAHRRAFPAAMSGVYVPEEMSRLDQKDRDEQYAARSKARQEAYAASHGPVTVVADPKPEQTADEPQSAAEVTEEVAAEVVENAEESMVRLRTELGWQSEVMGRAPATLANRWVARFRKNLDDFDVEEMHQMVVSLRDMVTRAAHSQKHPQAEAYDALIEAADGAPIDMSALVEVLDVETTEVDPDAEHPYVDDGGSCRDCGLAENVGNHP